MSDLEQQIWQQAFHVSHEGIIVADETGTIRFVNQASTTIFKYTKAEMVGAKVEMLLPERFKKLHSEHRKMYQKKPQTRLMRANNYGSEFSAEDKNGDELFLEINLSPFKTDTETLTIAVIRNVTERHTTQTQLEQFGHILDQSFDEIYILDGETLLFQQANKGALSNLGYTLEELQSKTPVDLMPDYTEEGFRLSLVGLDNGRKTLCVFQAHHERKDGTTYPVEVRLQKSGEFLIAVVMDITERKNAENALKEQENYLRAIFEATPECVSIVGEDGILFDINQTGLDMFGVQDKEQFIGTDFAQFAIPDHHTQLRNTFNNALFHRTTSTNEYEIIHIDGRRLYMSTRVVPLLDSDNNAVATLAITRDITDRKQQEDRIRHLAFHDPLTGLYNRLSFDEHLKRMVAHEQRYGAKFGLYVIDLDDFGNINNTLGHQVGDKLLQQLSARLSAFFKRDTDFVARYGGDEFVVVVSDTDSPSEKLIQHLMEPYYIDDHILNVTGSVGLALSDKQSDEEILRRADIAMYNAKNAGKNQFVIWSSDLTSDID